MRVLVLRAVNSGVAVSRSGGGEVQRWGGKGGVGGGERMRGSCIRELSGRREEGRGQGVRGMRHRFAVNKSNYQGRYPRHPHPWSVSVPGTGTIPRKSPAYQPGEPGGGIGGEGEV